MIKINQDNFDTQIKQYTGVVVAEFWSEECQPCKELTPKLSAIAEENNQVKHVQVDIQDNQKMLEEYYVTGLPTVLFFVDGNLRDRLVGVREQNVYQQMIQDLQTKESELAKEGQVDEKVTVFSTPTCPWCNKLKQFLTEYEIEFEDVDVSQDQEMAEKMVSRSGQMGVPQMWIGAQLVVGFDQPRVKKLLNIGE